MENKTRKKLNKIEKICLVGTLIGNSLIFYGAGLNIFSSSDNQNNFGSYGLLLNGVSLPGYLLSSKKRNKLEKQKNYYYKN